MRIALLCISDGATGVTVSQFLVALLKGFVFDTAVATYFALPAVLYLLVVPQKWFNTLINKILVSVGFFLTILITMFAFFAEITFWQEFNVRFNFIAVDYLIYTYEVVNNINQSYPLPWLISGMVLLTGIVIGIAVKVHAFRQTFRSDTPFRYRTGVTVVTVIVALLFTQFLSNSFAEKSHNRYANELSKAGIFSFFAAYRNNELDYNHFYPSLPEAEARAIVQQAYDEQMAGDSLLPRRTPNIILVTIESFSAEFMGAFGNEQGVTPRIDSIAREGLLFTKLYANGTRTVRGMEALALGVPPTPGNSIVRRPHNENLNSLGSTFAKAGYHSSFVYGGDGYFDNMNAFFGNNGFDIIDHGTRLTGDEIAGKHTRVPDEEVHFESAWGMCDEDIYAAALRDADEQQQQGKPFFQFIMTVSNHRPYTYPEGKIDIPSGTGRLGAVKYTDYALGEFIRQLKEKPWFDNTVVVIVADHCANSAGRNVINVNRYRIPAIIYNLPGHSGETIDLQCSQIDVFPTLFSLLGWQSENLFGRNVLFPRYEERTFVGTYQKLGYMQRDTLVVLSPGQRSEVYRVEENDTKLSPIESDSAVIKRAIAYYETAYLDFKVKQEENKER
jgi:phosphoglycerol transferase MdoB-like AlkP superfamily enzyme